MIKLSPENKLFVFNLSLVAGLIVLGAFLQKNNSENLPTPAVPGVVSTSSRESPFFLGVASDTLGTQTSGSISASSTLLVPAQIKTPPPPVRSLRDGEERNEND
jgi:hypothetical protein